MVRVIILGIDGLEYDLVVEWGLKYLLQKKWTKTDLSDFEVIVTPPIWSSMLTGKIIPEINSIFIKRYRFYTHNPKELKTSYKPYWIIKVVGPHVPASIRRFISRYFFPDPFKKTADFLLETKSYKTIFDYAKSPWTNGVPTYGRNVSTHEVKASIEEALKGNLRPLTRYALKTFEEDKSQLLRALSGEHDLIFWYTPFLDELSHFYITKKLKLMNIYITLNKFVRNVYNALDDGDCLYIISDHGMEIDKEDPRGGNHSDYGFFSSNTGELINKPQDLFSLVVKHLMRQ